MNTQTKWIASIFGFLTFILVILLILPFMIDFNKFKPQIQNIISQKLNAKVNFSSARLTIFSGLGIELQNVSLENTDELFKGAEVFKVKSIKFKTDLFPLFLGKFLGKIEINKPEINLMRSAGHNNMTSLIKKQNNKSNSENMEQKIISENKEDQATSTLPKNSPSSFKDRILIRSFEIKNATFHVYNISGPNEQEIAKVKNMNLTISNIGVAKDTKVEFSTDIDIKNDDMNAKGLVTLNLILNTELEGTNWKNTLFNGKLSLNNLDVNFRDAFVKKKSVPFYLSLSGIATPKNLIIDDFKLDLKSLDSKAKINISGYDKLNSDISIALSSSNMSDLGEIFPQHKQLLLDATLALKTRIIGALTQPETLIINLDLNSKLSNSDINLAFAANSVKPLIGSLQVKSQNLYLSQIIKPFMSKEREEPKKEVTKNETSKSSTETNKKKPNEESANNNEEFSLSEKEKKLLAGSEFSTDININKMVYNDLILNNFVLAAKIKNYNVSLSKLNLNVFSGNLSSNAAVDLSSSPIPFNGNISLNRIKVEDIFKFLKPNSEKSPIEGNADIKMNFNAIGITRASLSKSLNSKGSFFFNDGMLNAKSLVTLAGQQFNQFISNTSIGVMKIDSDSLKKLSLSDDMISKKSLKNQKGEFEIKDGKLLLRNNISSDDGTLKLHADVGLDESLKGNAVYIASRKIKEQLVAQSKYAKYLLNEKGEFELDLTLAGTVSSPDVTINTSVLQARLVKNASKELTKKIKEEIKKNPDVKKLQDDAQKLLEKNGIDLQKLGF